MTALHLLLSVGVGYLLGSLPFGVLVCRLRGRDPRKFGSGRTGGTNVYRTAGLAAALATIVLDVGKGYAAVIAARWLVPAETMADAAAWAVPLAGLAAIAGHNWSLFVGFQGGAGSTPNIGAVLAMDPLLFAFGAAIAVTFLVGVRIASVASMTLSTLLGLGLVWRVIDGALPPQTLVYAVGQLALVLWALRPNIRRLRGGDEKRFDLPWQRKRPAEG